MILYDRALWNYENSMLLFFIIKFYLGFFVIVFFSNILTFSWLNRFKKYVFGEVMHNNQAH
jgi:hypothetical protein